MRKGVKNVHYGKEHLYNEQKSEEGGGGAGHHTEVAMKYLQRQIGMKWWHNQGGMRSVMQRVVPFFRTQKEHSCLVNTQSLNKGITAVNSHCSVHFLAESEARWTF